MLLATLYNLMVYTVPPIFLVIACISLYKKRWDYFLVSYLAVIFVILKI